MLYKESMTNNMLDTLASYVPTLVVSRLVTQPEPLTSAYEQSLNAAILFADFSGFTRLAEHLAEQGPGGAEELSRFLNAKFNELISTITLCGGDVVTFAGDALLAIWDANTPGTSTDRVQRAAHCGLSLQTLINANHTNSPVQLSARIGISIGSVRMVHVGGVYERWLWMMTGLAITRVIQAEQQAQPGQVVLSPEVWRLIHSKSSGQVLKPTYQVVVHTVDEPTPPDKSNTSPIFPEMEPALRSYIPGSVLSRVQAGQGNWLAELRRITVLFINLPELNDPNLSVEHIQDRVRAIQSIVYRYEGSINKISMDDKGVTLIGVFGLPPLSHEDDAVRGVQSALVIHQNIAAMGVDYAIGITTGKAFCGIIGNQQRREYTILGRSVNLAARLMQIARSKNDILCNETTYQATCHRLVFDELDPVSVKGKQDKVALYRPVGEAELCVLTHRRELIGRTEERSVIVSLLQQLQRVKLPSRGNYEASVLLIEGDAGIGKSCLLEELHRQAQLHQLAVLNGAGEAIEHTTPFFVWRRIFTLLLDLEKIADPNERRQHVLDLLASEPALLVEASLLNTVIPLEIPTNKKTEDLTGQALAEAIRSLLLDVLQLCIGGSPTVLVLEDAQWLDTASWALTLEVCRKFPSLLLVIATRPMTEPLPEPYRAIMRLQQMHYLRLEPLSRVETAELVCQYLRVTQVPDTVLTLIYDKSQGNPFYTEQLTLTLHDTNQVQVEHGTCQVAADIDDVQMIVPNTIQGVITSRIDRLAPSQQLTLKVASVIGTSFMLRTLCEVYPVSTTTTELEESLHNLEQTGLIQIESSEPDLVYRFTHVTVQEVVYHLMALAQRKQLHCALGEWYVQEYFEYLDDYAPLLAQHFDLADDPRAQQYHTLAGNVALRLYATVEALQHYNRALEIARANNSISEHFQYIYTRRGQVLELLSDYSGALDNYQQMERLADKHSDSRMKLTALMGLATLYSSTNSTFDPHQAEVLLDLALSLARELRDKIAESKILWNLMMIKILSSGNQIEAVTFGERSLALARTFKLREQMARTLTDLSLAYRNSGQSVRSQTVLEEACILWRKLDNLPMLTDTLARYALGHFLSGVYDQVIAASDEAAHISQSIGYVSGQANSRLIVGHVYLEQGNVAQAIEVMKQAISLGEQGGHLPTQIGTRSDLACVYGMCGAIAEGIKVARQACAIAEEHKNLLRSWALAVLARLLIKDASLSEAETVIKKSYHFLRMKNEILLAPMYVPLADAELALAKNDYPRAIALIDKLLDYLDAYQIRPFTTDALMIKIHALLATGNRKQVYKLLQRARSEAELLGSKRTLWQILWLLSRIEAQMSNVEDAAALQQQARANALYVADHMGNSDLRESFLHLPEVQMVLG